MIYDHFAAIYDAFMAPLESLFLRRARIETLATILAGKTVLEVGAGTGLNFAHYPHCQNAIASDYSLQMLKRAKSRAESIKLIQADAHTLPFPENSFDAAFATLVLCSVAKPDAVLKQLKCVVRPKGQIILLEHVRPPGLLGYVFDVLNWFTVALIDDHFNRRTADIAENSGLIVREVRKKAFGVINLIICENPPMTGNSSQHSES